LLVQFELLLCVEDESDPAVKIVRQLQDRYPLVSCRLFSGGKSGIINPMVFNMAPAYDNATYDVVWICTSRIKGKLTESLVALTSFLKKTDFVVLIFLAELLDSGTVHVRLLFASASAGCN
jgi:ceramide glucosyltransferase